MSTAGPNSSGTQANTARASSISSWASASNAASSNDSRATTSLSSGLVTHSDWLKVTNFGFSIPSGATIDGVTVEIERGVTSAVYHPRDSSLMLVKGGTISSTDKASGTTWPVSASEAYATYGGAADLWGLSLADTDVNATDFGVALSVTSDNTGKGSVSLQVDHIRITIDYTAGGGGGGQPISKRFGGVPFMGSQPLQGQQRWIKRVSGLLTPSNEWRPAHGIR